MEDEELQQREDYLFECGKPLWGDCLQTERIDYRLKMIALQKELSRIPDALQWLELVLQGEKALTACRKLRRGREWLSQVEEACKRVLLE